MGKFRRRDAIAIVILILVAVILTFFFLFEAYNHYSVWRSHRDYFNKPGQRIEPWMTLGTLETRFNVTSQEFFREAEVNGTRINRHMTIDRFCEQHNQNCTDFTERLNRLIGK